MESRSVPDDYHIRLGKHFEWTSMHCPCLQVVPVVAKHWYPHACLAAYLRDSASTFSLISCAADRATEMLQPKGQSVGTTTQSRATAHERRGATYARNSSLRSQSSWLASNAVDGRD